MQVPRESMHVLVYRQEVQKELERYVATLYTHRSHQALFYNVKAVRIFQRHTRAAFLSPGGLHYRQVLTAVVDRT